MQVIRYPDRSQWAELTVRPTSDITSKMEIVSQVMEKVRTEGDQAIRKYTLQFDKVDLMHTLVTEQEIQEASNMISSELKNAIDQAAANILKFHRQQKQEFSVVETTPGVTCWQKSVPIHSVGLYIPGGSAPLFSTVLMLGIPAMIAGCPQVILCTPPNSEGKIDPAILYAASVCRIQSIYKIGGIQAIAAMAYGTESIPGVDKIFGPGNSWVTAAKQYISTHKCAIDMPAGPSEVAVMADESGIPSFIASDLLSQAEHGPDSQVLLVTTNEKLINEVIPEVEQQLIQLPRRQTATKALENSRLILVDSTQEMIDLINYYAPEHLIIAMNKSDEIAETITNAGSVFIGNFTPESAGDYASGTNHTLPTNGWARSFSGITLDSFCKKITYQKITQSGIQNLGPIIEVMAEAELLFAHKNAASLRINFKE